MINKMETKSRQLMVCLPIFERLAFKEENEREAINSAKEQMAKSLLEIG